MKLKTLIELLKLDTLYIDDKALNKEYEFFFASNMMSNVLLMINDNYQSTILLTGLTNAQSLITAEMLDVILMQIDQCIDTWLNLANQKGDNLVYFISRFGRRNPNEFALFASPEDFEGEVPSDKWLVPNALRVIEPESIIHVIR